MLLGELSFPVRSGKQRSHDPVLKPQSSSNKLVGNILERILIWSGPVPSPQNPQWWEAIDFSFFCKLKLSSLGSTTQSAMVCLRHFSDEELLHAWYSLWNICFRNVHHLGLSVGQIDIHPKCHRILSRHAASPQVAFIVFEDSVICSQFALSTAGESATAPLLSNQPHGCKICLKTEICSVSDSILRISPGKLSGIIQSCNWSTPVVSLLHHYHDYL